MLRINKYKQFVKFQKLDWFTKTHSSFCSGKFEQVWVRGVVTMSRCAECGSVAYLTTVSTKPTLTDAPNNRPKQIPSLTLPSLEGFIPRYKLGLVQVEYKSDKETFKFNNNCLNCGQHFKSDKPKDVCPDCFNVSLGDSGLDYDKFYKDSNDTWQQGDHWEVGSNGPTKSKKPVPRYIPSPAVIKLHVSSWLFEIMSETEIMKRCREWLKPQNVTDHLRIDAIVQSVMRQHGC